MFLSRRIRRNKTWFLKNLSIFFVTMYWMVDNGRISTSSRTRRKRSERKELEKRGKSKKRNTGKTVNETTEEIKLRENCTCYDMFVGKVSAITITCIL